MLISITVNNLRLGFLLSFFFLFELAPVTVEWRCHSSCSITKQMFFGFFFCVSGFIDGDLPGQPNPSTDCSEREAGAALKGISSKWFIFKFCVIFFLAEINKAVKESYGVHLWLSDTIVKSVKPLILFGFWSLCFDLHSCTTYQIVHLSIPTLIVYFCDLAKLIIF